MYPGPEDPDLGVFVAQLAAALSERGHDIEAAVLTRRRGGKARFVELQRKVRRAKQPDVVWAHFLVPSGLIASTVDAPLVVTAHGRDVRNIGAIPGVAALSRRVVDKAAAVIAVSEYLRRELELRLPESRGKTVVIDSGVDTNRFRPGTAPALGEHPAFLAVGTLSERKNVVGLADAFARLRRGSLTFVGDGPLRDALEGRDRVAVIGRVPHEDVPRYIRGADVVCAASLLEPLGQTVLEAMAVGRTVVATRFGGPPELLPPEAGILVDPLDADELAWALEGAAALPVPNEAGREVAAAHAVTRQAERVEEVLVRAARGLRV